MLTLSRILYPELSLVKSTQNFKKPFHQLLELAAVIEVAFNLLSFLVCLSYKFPSIFYFFAITATRCIVVSTFFSNYLILPYKQKEESKKQNFITSSFIFFTHGNFHCRQYPLENSQAEVQLKLSVSNSAAHVE